MCRASHQSADCHIEGGAGQGFKPMAAWLHAWRL
jgi:hypothetical protein